MAITTTDIVTEWGAYYVDRGQTVQDLINKFYEQEETKEVLFQIPTENDRLERASVEISRVLQRFQKAWTPIGDTTFEPRIIELYHQKIDVEATPDDIENSWLGFLSNSNLSRAEWPLVRYWLEELILKQKSEDLEVHEYFKGVPSAITPGTPTVAGASMLGLRKIINDEITATTITPITTGAPAAAPVDFVDQIEDFIDAIPDKYITSIRHLAMSKALHKRFRRGMREKYNMSYAQFDELDTIADTSIMVKGLKSMEGSTKWWCTPFGNAVVGVKRPQNQNVFKVEELKREVYAHTDFRIGVGFFRPDWVFTNNQDLV